MRRLSADARARLVIVAVVLVANGLYLTGITDPDPLGPRSGLTAGPPATSFPGQPTIDPTNGFISQALGHRAALDVVHGRMPWWNPYAGTGTPLAGELQSAALFPPTLLTLLENGQLYERILLEIIAGLATFAVLRRLRLRRWASTAGGAAFALNGTFAWFAHAAVNPVAFLPLLVLGIEHARAAAEEDRRGGWALVGTALALSLYAGFPETAYLDGLLALGWSAWRAGGLGRSRRVALARKAVAGGVLGALLSAPLAAAAGSFFSQAYLSQHVDGYYGGLHPPSGALSQLVLPYLHGPIFGKDPQGLITGTWGGLGGYASAALLVLGLLGLAATRGRRGLKVLLGVWILLVVARMYHLPPVLWHVWGVLPRMGDVWVSRYGFPALSFALVVLSAVGLDGAARGELLPRRTLACVGLSALVVLAAGAGGWSLAQELTYRPAFFASLAMGLMVVAAVAVLLRTGRGRFLPLVLMAEAVVLFAVPTLSAPRAVREDRAPVAFLQDRLGTQRFFSLGTFQPNYGSYFGLASLASNDLPPKPFARFIRARLDPTVNPVHFVGYDNGERDPGQPQPAALLVDRVDGYRAAGVGWVVTPPGVALPRPAFVPSARTPSSWVYRLTGAAPYWSAPGCRIRASGRAEARVTCEQATTLVRRETALEGWRATVDGREAPMAAPDQGLFQTVRVPAGTHRLAFAYRPPHMGLALLAFALGLLALVAGAVLRRRA